ncbi:hypothetical protein CDL15_Pgr018299 [Punica granatum]|uniref:Uncharacterized protein n=1 Tax=Punica granatum TaxID=22663 RepID=A0A218WHV0_PUNGR|nr:hypothetical protein CDL15_Pgr018299 [Punica granatum]
MNWAKLSNVSTAIKSTVNHKLSFKSNPTITLSILESGLLRCRTPKQFNQILSQMILTGYLKDAYAASRLLKFSIESSFVPVDYSLQIFTRLENSNGFTWNTMMRALVQRKNSPQDAILLYKSMLNENVGPDNYTYPILIQAAALLVAHFEGKQVHGHALKLGFDLHVYVGNTLINMYSVCGNMRDARRVFDGSPELDRVSWNSILAGYVQIGDVEEAKRVFDRMPQRNTIASNSMIVLFGKTGRVGDAFDLFNELDEKDMVSWSAIISCYEQNRMYEDALGMFKRMCAGGIELDEVVLVSILSACAHMCAGEIRKSVHGLAIKMGIESYLNLLNALIHMYSKCEEVSEAQKLFDVGHHNLDLISWNSMISGYIRSGLLERAEALFYSMPEKDLISWSAMISGYAQHDQFSKTLELFQEMQLSGIRPDETILVSVISACTHLGALDLGRWVHAYISKNGLNVNVILGTTLLDMYMKYLVAVTFSAVLKTVESPTRKSRWHISSSYW